MAAEHHEQAEHINRVSLTGRLGAVAQERTMPSGDTMAQFRLVVQRPVERVRTARATVDTLDCVVWTARLRRRIAVWSAGDLVEVTGSLRRRFWRGVGGGPVSRHEVEVIAARRVRRVTMTG